MFSWIKMKTLSWRSGSRRKQLRVKENDKPSMPGAPPVIQEKFVNFHSNEILSRIVGDYLAWDELADVKRDALKRKVEAEAQRAQKELDKMKRVHTDFWYEIFEVLQAQGHIPPGVEYDDVYMEVNRQTSKVRICAMEDEDTDMPKELKGLLKAMGAPPEFFKKNKKQKGQVLQLIPKDEETIH